MKKQQNVPVKNETGSENLTPGQKERLYAAMNIVIKFLVKKGHLHSRYLTNQAGQNKSSELAAKATRFENDPN